MKINCKVCGSPLQYQAGEVLACCSCCGTEQSVPAVITDEMAAMMNRANALRMQEQFEEAQAIYETIIQHYGNMSEAWWGLALSNYGAVLESNPGEKCPKVTLKLSKPEQVLKTKSYRMALQNAPAVARDHLHSEALLLHHAWLAQQEDARKACTPVTDTFVGLRTKETMGEADIKAVCDFMAGLGYEVIHPLTEKTAAANSQFADEKLRKKKYLQGQSLMELGNLSAAAEAFDASLPYSDAAEKIKKIEILLAVQKAENLLAADDAQAAYRLLKEYAGSEEADQLLLAEPLASIGREEKAYLEKMAQPPAKAVDSRFQTGCKVSFGRYIQSVSEEGECQPEALSWIVLAREGSQALLMTEQAIACLPFHPVLKGITWKDSALRTWLNSDFIADAFDESEADAIVTRTVRTPCHPLHGTDGGEDVTDRAFVLSQQEAMQYLPEAESRKALATAASAAKGVWVNKDGHCWWWLRNAGKTASRASVVYSTGDFFFYSVHNTESGVRPALWVNLNSDCFNQ